jgi:hypothetical protein
VTISTFRSITGKKRRGNCCCHLAMHREERETWFNERCFLSYSIMSPQTNSLCHFQSFTIFSRKEYKNRSGTRHSRSQFSSEKNTRIGQGRDIRKMSFLLSFMFPGRVPDRLCSLSCFNSPPERLCRSFSRGPACFRITPDNRKNSEWRSNI